MKTLLPKTVLVVALIITQFNVQAQEASPISNSTSIGLQIGQYQRDMVGGINITSPYFANGKVAVRGRSNVAFHQHTAQEASVWTPYMNGSLGVVAVSGIVADAIKLYGEGGIVMLFPSKEFSTGSTVTGGYGHFGFEFYMQDAYNYFIEIGGVGTGANEDNIEAGPIYSNGLSISVGFRVHL